MDDAELANATVIEATDVGEEEPMTQSWEVPASENTVLSYYTSSTTWSAASSLAGSYSSAYNQFGQNQAGSVPIGSAQAVPIHPGSIHSSHSFAGSVPGSIPGSIPGSVPEGRVYASPVIAPSSGLLNSHPYGSFNSTTSANSATSTNSYGSYNSSFFRPRGSVASIGAMPPTPYDTQHDLQNTLQNNYSNQSQSQIQSQNQSQCQIQFPAQYQSPQVEASHFARSIPIDARYLAPSQIERSRSYASLGTQRSQLSSLLAQNRRGSSMSINKTKNLGQTNQIGQVGQMNQFGQTNQMNQMSQMNQTNQFGQVGQIGQIGQTNQMGQMSGISAVPVPAQISGQLSTMSAVPSVPGAVPVQGYSSTLYPANINSMHTAIDFPDHVSKGLDPHDDFPHILRNIKHPVRLKTFQFGDYKNNTHYVLKKITNVLNTIIQKNDKLTDATGSIEPLDTMVHNSSAVVPGSIGSSSEMSAGSATSAASDDTYTTAHSSERPIDSQSQPQSQTSSQHPGPELGSNATSFNLSNDPSDPTFLKWKAANNFQHILLRFHGCNVPGIALDAYLDRILKYCPSSADVFIALLVYVDRIVEKGLALDSPFLLDSYNVHRLVIAGMTVSSKFFSDVFYKNSRYAKVGGLSVEELNILELQFLILLDFKLRISVEELQLYADFITNYS